MSYALSFPIDFVLAKLFILQAGNSAMCSKIEHNIIEAITIICCAYWVPSPLFHRCQLSRYGRDTHDIKAPVPVPPDQRTPSMTVPTRLMTIAIDYAYYYNLWLCTRSTKQITSSCMARAKKAKRTRS